VVTFTRLRSGEHESRDGRYRIYNPFPLVAMSPWVLQWRPNRFECWTFVGRFRTAREARAHVEARTTPSPDVWTRPLPGAP
jgi:hypothetical protein